MTIKSYLIQSTYEQLIILYIHCLIQFFEILILHGGNKGNCLNAPGIYCLGALEMFQEKFTISSQGALASLPRRKCLGALSKTKHTGLYNVRVFFLPLFPCSFSDQLNPNCHRFVIFNAYRCTPSEDIGLLTIVFFFLIVLGIAISDSDEQI